MSVHVVRSFIAAQPMVRQCVLNELPTHCIVLVLKCIYHACIPTVVPEPLGRKLKTNNSLQMKRNRSRKIGFPLLAHDLASYQSTKPRGVIMSTRMLGKVVFKRPVSLPTL